MEDQRATEESQRVAEREGRVTREGAEEPRGVLTPTPKIEEAGRDVRYKLSDGDGAAIITVPACMVERP